MKKSAYYLVFGDYKLSFDIPITGNILAFFTAISVCVMVSGFLYMIPGKALLYQSVCALSLLYIIFKGSFSFNKKMLFLYAVILLNVLVLPIDAVFQSQKRALYFIFITLVCSPTIISRIGIAYRERVFRYIIIGWSILTVLSFFCFFWGINMMPFNREGNMDLYDDYMNAGGKFSGLFNHSMIFGPVAAIVSLVHFNLYLKYKKKIRLILFFICFMACLFSASRAALLAMFTGIVCVLYKALRTSNSIISFKSVAYATIFVVLSIIPFADVVFSGLSDKIRTTQEEFGGYNSRSAKYARRLYEFSESPIMGIGFASVDKKAGSVYNPTNGQIEPGTSHLAVLAQTGLLGMVAYIVLLYGALKPLKKRSTINSFIAFSIFWLFFAHGWGEGWIFAPGGMICFVFWLSLSQCYDIKYKEKLSNV